MSGLDAQGPVERAPRSARVAFRARFDECGPDALARPSAILRWAQDAAWIHSERLGFGREWYAERDLAWVVRAMEAVILAPIRMSGTVEVETRVVGFRRVMARRRTEVWAIDGTLAARIDNDWVLTDVRRAAPARIPEVFQTIFEVPPGSFEPIRVALPMTPADPTTLPVMARPQEIDPIGHVNNAVYLDWLEEAVRASAATIGTDDKPAGLAALPRTYRLEYLLPVGLGAAHLATAWPEGSGWAYRLRVADGPDALRGTLTTG